jgi:endonuclease/exonuclease/phosphatase family metal-dependent hydrolase
VSKTPDNHQNIDDLVIRCRRLGHEVPFKYCRTLEGQTVCPSIRDCWWERFDVDSWLKESLTPDEYEKLVAGAPPPPKVSRILDIIESVKKKTKMARLVLLVVLMMTFFQVGLGAAEPPPAPPETVRVAFMNLHNYAAPSSTDVKSDESRTAVHKLLAQTEADILVLAEVGNRPALDQIAEGIAKYRKGHNYTYRHLIQAEDRIRHLAVLATQPPAVEDHRDKANYSVRDKTLPVRRGYAYCVFEWSNGYRLHVVGAHLKSKVYHPEGQTDMRRYEARYLRYLVDDIQKAEPKANILVVGDFNDTMDSSPLKTLFARRKSEVRELFDLRPCDQLGTSWTHWWRQADDYARIDYALASYYILPEVDHKNTFLAFPNDWDQASDHRAVIVALHPRDQKVPESILDTFPYNIHRP